MSSRLPAAGRLKPIVWILWPLLAAMYLLVSDGSAESLSSERGEYIFRASGGCSCHNDTEAGGAFMAGGRPVSTPFGAVYATNITPDYETGIGGWSDADFLLAMTQGVGPEGQHYLPAFPYTSFTRMAESDLLDLKAYLFSLPAVRSVAPPQGIPAPFRWRFSLLAWKALHFRSGPFQPEPDSSQAWNRGAYLVTAVAHCGECHTPRGRLGGLRSDRTHGGTSADSVPNITPDTENGIGAWSTPDLVWYMQHGLGPDGDSAQGVMQELIDSGYRYLTDEDLKAIDHYLRSLPAIR
ncbi:MAG: cytochrome c [Candidatus Latescibacterota bacterium]|nr:cytochrome c [Candidatus Latescibacterota bacterium]